MNDGAREKYATARLFAAGGRRRKDLRAPSSDDGTTDILSKMLGLSEADIERLYQDGVVHRTEPFTTPQIDAANP